MSKPTNWLRRTAVAGTTTALALGGVMALSGPASARVTENSFTIPVTGVNPPAEDVAIGPAQFTEDQGNDIFVAGAGTVTLTLSDGATFTDDTVGASGTARISGSGSLGFGDGRATRSADGSTLTFTYTGGPTSGTAIENASVSGLEVDVPASMGGTVDITAAVSNSTFTDTDPVINRANIADTNRVGGQDRYGTAAKAFRLNPFVGNGDAAVLAGGGDYPDALSANYLAGELATGTLLTGANKLAVDARQAIIDNDVSEVYVIGGTTAVSDAVANELKQTRVGDEQDTPFIQVIRLGGSNRYETNARVNTYEQDGLQARSDRALVASGEGFADALAFGPLAWGAGDSAPTPLILTPGASLGTQARQQLEQFNPVAVDIAGGTSSISAATQQQIEDAANVQQSNRFGGAERTETAAKIAQYAQSTDNYGDFGTDPVSVANGAFYADSVAAGPYVAAQGTPLLITKNASTVGAGLTTYLNSLDANDATLQVFGLTAAFPQDLVNKVRAALGNDNQDNDNN